MGALRIAQELALGTLIEAEDELQPIGPHAQWIVAVDHELARKAAP
jgi:hypothetical protein